VAGLRDNDVFSKNYVPPSHNEQEILPGIKQSDPPRPLPETGQFERGLRRGVDTLQAGAYGAVEAAGEAVGSETLQEFGAEGYEQSMEEAASAVPANVESVFDIDSVESFLDWAAYGLGTLAPSALTMIGTGGAGALVGGAMKAAQAGAVTGAFAGSAVPETGHAFKDLQAEGVTTPGMAALEGGIIGLLDVAPQAHLLKILGTAVPKRGVVRGVARGIADQAPREALTEAAQEGVSEGFKYGLVEGYENPEMGKQLVEAGSLGALGGGFAGGVGGGVRGALQREATPQLPVPGLAASESLNDMQQGDLTFDEVGGTGASAMEQELQNLGFEPRELQLDVPITDTHRLSGSARELLGMPEDTYKSNLQNQLDELNQPFVAEQIAAYEAEQAQQPSVTKMLESLGTFKSQLQDRKITEVFDVPKTGDLAGLETFDMPNIINKILVPEKAGEQVTMKTLLSRIDAAEQQLADVSLRGIEQTTPEFRGPFEGETLLQRTEREALSMFPDDVELQRSFINERGEELFTEESGGNTNRKIIELLKEQGKVNPNQILDPAEKQKAKAKLNRIEDKLKKLRSKERVAMRTGVSRIYDPANPGEFLANYEGIKTPPLTEVRSMLESKNLSPELRTKFTNILKSNRNENAGESLAGANLGRSGKAPKYIFFSANENYDVSQYPGQIRVGNNVLNVRNLTNFARKERQREELTTSTEVTGKPREAHGERTEDMRLFNDVMLGLEMAAEQKLIQLPEGSAANTIIAPGALKTAMERGGAERQQAQLALKQLVNLIGADTVVAGDKGTAKTFGQVLASAQISKAYNNKILPEAEERESVEPENMLEARELARAQAELDKPNLAPKPDFTTQVEEAQKTVDALRTTYTGQKKTLDTMIANKLPEADIARARNALKGTAEAGKAASNELKRVKELNKRLSFSYPHRDFAEGVPPYVVLPTESIQYFKKGRVFELRGRNGGNVTAKFTGKTKELSHTEKITTDFRRGTGLLPDDIDRLFASTDSVTALGIEVLEKPSNPTKIKLEQLRKVAAKKAKGEKAKAKQRSAPPKSPKPVQPSAVEQYQKRRDAIADLTTRIAVGSPETRAEKMAELKKLKAEHRKLSKEAAVRYTTQGVPKASASIKQTYVNTKELLADNNPYAEKIAKQYFKQIKAPQNIYLMSSKQAAAYLTKEVKLDWLANLANGTLHGFTTPAVNGRIGVYVRPGLSEQLTREVLAHEIGHAVYGGYVHTLKDSMASKIMQEYLGWRKKYGKDNTTIEQLLRSKKQPKSVLLTLVDTRGTTTLDQTSDALRDYLLDFDEWFADSVSRWFTETRQPKTGMERFFQAIADTLKRMVGIAPKGNIDSLMDSLAGGKRSWGLPFSPQDGMAAAQSLPLTSNDIEQLNKLATKSKIAELTSKPDASNLVYVATLGDQDPYGHAFHRAFAEWILDDRIEQATANVLLNAARTKHVQNQLRNLLSHDRTALDQLADPYDAAAYMYQFWRAGLIKLGARTDNIFQRIANAFRKVLGVVAESERAENLFKALERSSDPFEASATRSAVAKVLPNSLAENAIQTFQPSYELAMKPIRSLFFTVDERIKGYGIPSLTKIAEQFHNRPGEFVGNPTLQAQKQQFKGRFENRIRRIFDGKDAQFGNEAIEYLYGAKDLNQAPPGVQRVVKQVRALFAEMRKYQKDAGVNTKQNIKDYFPWVINQDAMSSKVDEFRAVLSQDKYAKKRKELAVFMNMRQHKNWMTEHYQGLSPTMLEKAFKQFVETGEWTLQIKKDKIMVDIPQPENLLDGDSMVDYMIRSATAEGSMDFEVSEDRQVPVMRFNNPRLFKFVDPVEMRPFLNNDLGEVTGTYISQAVKHAEFTRRFGEDGEGLRALLDDAKAQGATPIQLKATVNYVKATMGTYGRHTAEWLHKYTGMALPEHQFSPINEGLNKAMGVAIVYQNLRYLALATLTSLSDVMGIAVRSSEMGSIVRATKAFMQRNKSNLNDLGEMLGIIEHSQVSDALGARFDGMHLTGKLRRFNDGFFRVIGLEAWTRTTRLMGLAAAEAFIVKHSQRPNKHSKRWLNELNLTAEDVQLRDDGTLRVFSHAERLVANPKEVARDDRIRAALIQWTDEAILRPNPSMRTLWGSDPHFQLFQYLKSFMYTFHERILKRVGHEAMEGNYAAFVGLLAYIPTMIVADLLREVIQYGSAGNPRKANWGAADYIQHGAIRGGLLGYAQQGVDIHTDMKWGGYGVGGMAATFDTIASIPDLVTMKPGAVVKALPGQTVYSNWF